MRSVLIGMCASLLAAAVPWNGVPGNGVLRDETVWNGAPGDAVRTKGVSWSAAEMRAEVPVENPAAALAQGPEIADASG